VGKKFTKVLIGVVEIVAAIYTWGGSLSTLFLNAGISTLASVAISAFGGARRQAPPPLNVTLRGTVEFRRIVFGRCRCGGVLVFYGTSGTDNKYLWYVIAYAGHQSSAFSDFWLDERRIASSDIPSGGGGTVTASPWNSKLNIWKHLGTSTQTVDTNMSGAFGAWDSNHKLLGNTYAVLRMERDDTVFPDGAPQSASALLDGLLTYDARLDSTNGGSGSSRYTNPSTWTFTRDPVQHIRWYLTGGSVHNASGSPLKMYGLKELDSRIDDAYTIASSNICDQVLSGAVAPPSGSQNRYRCDLEVNCGETRREILQALLATMAGTLVYVSGKWRIHAGAYDSPSHTLTQDDLYGDLDVQDTIGHDARYNAVAPIYIDAAKQYIQTTGIYRTDSAYETQDGGERIPKELVLDGVTDIYQAQRLAEIDLRQSRMMRSVRLVGALNLLKVALHETIQFSHSRYSWTNRVFRCKEKQLDFNEEAGRVTLNTVRDDAGVWADMLTADYTSGTSDTDVFTSDGPDSTVNWPGATYVDQGHTAGPVAVSGTGAIQGATPATFSVPAQGKNAQAIVTATYEVFLQNIAGTQVSQVYFDDGVSPQLSTPAPNVSGTSADHDHQTITWTFDYVAGRAVDISLLWQVTPVGSPAPNSATYSDITIQWVYVFR